MLPPRAVLFDTTAPSGAVSRRKPLQAVFFDLDGTLVHSLDAILDAFHHALAAGGHAPVEPAEIARHVGIPLRDMFLRVVDGCDHAMAEACCAAYRARYAEAAPALTRLQPGVPDVLHRIGDVPLAVVTTKATEPARRALHHAGLLPHFRTVVGFDDVKRPKPAPDGVLVAAERLGVAPHECCLVGDTVYDVQAARDAGALAVGVLTGTGTRKELQAAGAHFVIENLHALPGVFHGR